MQVFFNRAKTIKLDLPVTVGGSFLLVFLSVARLYLPVQ